MFTSNPCACPLQAASRTVHLFHRGVVKVENSAADICTLGLHTSTPTHTHRNDLFWRYLPQLHRRRANARENTHRLACRNRLLAHGPDVGVRREERLWCCVESCRQVVQRLAEVPVVSGTTLDSSTSSWVRQLERLTTGGAVGIDLNRQFSCKLVTLTFAIAIRRIWGGARPSRRFGSILGD